MFSIKKIFFYIVIVLSTVLVIITLLSLIPDVKIWYYKILDFPRLQFLILGILLLVLFLLLNKKWNFPSILFLLGLITVISVHGLIIFPYLFGNVSVPDHVIESAKNEDTFDVLIANVLINNRESALFLNIVKKYDPDILLAMEVNEWWIEKLKVLEENYSYKMEYPLDNAYGMALYSKLPINQKEIKFLSQHDVPSFHLAMILPSGKSFSFYAVHPVAPVPSKKYPDNEDEKELELLRIGSLVAKNKSPSIVAGDFNDISWSQTSKVFGESGKLNNVRIGRGLYNTFNSTSFFMRWPLDHYFVTKEFALMRLERLSKFGSDHFPLYAKFALVK